MSRVITVRTNEPEWVVRARLRRFVRQVASRNESSDVRTTVLGAIAHEVLTQNRIDFDRKSQGQPDRFGETWAPLAPSTIAAKISKRVRLMSPGRAKQFRALTDRYAAIPIPGATPAQVRAKAREMAYAAVGRQILINVDTGKLRASLTPSVALRDRLMPTTDQVATVSFGRLLVGTSVKYARYTHRGTSRMPARPVLATARQSVGWVREGLRKGVELAVERIARELR